LVKVYHYVEKTYAHLMFSHMAVSLFRRDLISRFPGIAVLLPT